MPPSFEIINDAIVAHGGDYDHLTPRENNVRNAMAVITYVGPLFGSFIIWLFSYRGWKYNSWWTYSRLSIAWFLSITLFGALVFNQRGVTNRLTFMLAVFHTQIEVLINAYLLNISAKKALTIAGIWGLLLYLNNLVESSMVGVFFGGSVLGGANDILIFFILAYGKRWMYAAGALFHVLSAIVVFTDAVIFLDVVTYNALIFLTLWLHVGFTVMAILEDSPPQGEYSQVAQTEEIARPEHYRNPHNPMPKNVPHCVLFIMIVLGLISSTTTSVLLYIYA